MEDVPPPPINRTTKPTKSLPTQSSISQTQQQQQPPKPQQQQQPKPYQLPHPQQQQQQQPPKSHQIQQPPQRQLPNEKPIIVPSMKTPPPVIQTTTPPPPTKKTFEVANDNKHIKKVVVHNSQVFSLRNGTISPLGQGLSLEVVQQGKEAAYIRAESLSIPLVKDVPTLCTSPLCYLFMTQSQFYMIKLTLESKEFLEVLNTYSAYYQPTIEEPKEVDGETDNTKYANTAASKIESGGTIVAQGLIKGASLLGVGIKKTTNVIIENTDKGTREVTPEEKIRIEQRQKTTQNFLSGTRTVAGGIGKGAAFVGRGIAKGVHKAQDMTASKEKEAQPEKESATKKAAIGVTGSTLNALGSIKTGLCESTRIVSSDIRDNSVRVTQHREGDESARLTEQQFNMAGQVTVGTFHAASIAASTTVKLAVDVGAAAATYDKNWEELLKGTPWRAGWIASQDNTLDPWTSKWFVLRTFSLAMYKDKLQDPLKPILYIPLNEIKSVEPVSSEVTKKGYCFKIVTKSSLMFLSVDCSDLSRKLDDFRSHDNGKYVEEWIHSLNSLARICRGEVNV